MRHELIPIEPHGGRLKVIHQTLAILTSSPHAHDLMELVLATATSLPLCQADHASPVWLLVEGNPSSGKTETVFTLKGVDSVFALDTLTENSFLSGYVEEAVPGQRKPKKKPQLLDSLDGKTVVIKDMTTLLSGRDDKVKKILGELQSIYDGEYAKATGTVGVLRSKSVFSMIACVTPAAIRSHHRYMSMIGGRFLCFRLPALTDIERQHGFERSWQESQREQNLRFLRAMIREHVSELLKAPINLEPESAEVQATLNELALLLARGRGILLTEKMHDLNETTGEERFFYELADPQIEEPYRALQQLRTLARASARVHGRQEVTSHDLELVRRVVFGSMPKTRAEALMCFQYDRNVLNRPQFSALLGKRESSTRKLIDEMEALQPLAMEEVQAEKIYRPVSDLSSAITVPIEPLDHLDDG